MMNVYFEDTKFIDNDIVYPFNCHVQVNYGQQMAAWPHYHKNIEILYCVSGSFQILLDGMENILEKGDMIIINSMETHTCYSLSEKDNAYLVIRFEPELLYTSKESIFESKYVLPFTIKASTHQKLFKEPEIKDTFIPDLLLQIITEHSKKEYGFELAIRNHISQIFLWILRKWHHNNVNLNIDSGLNASTIERLQKTFDYVEQHYAEDIKVEAMAELCNMSYSYFSRFFKSKMQQSFTDYLSFIRVTKASNLLTTSDFSITEIGATVGFSTTSYFISKFKEVKDMTPLQYRKAFDKMVS